MAFTTRTDFYLVPFLDEEVTDCQEACTKLKSYASTVDERSWAADDVKKSRFYVELISCDAPRDGGDGSRGRAVPRSRPVGAAPEGSGATADPLDPKATANVGGMGDVSTGESPFSTLNLQEGDSVMDCLARQLSEMEKVNAANRDLQKELETSNEKLEISNAQLNTANLENQQIKNILERKFDHAKTQEFLGRIQQLSGAGQLPKGIEGEMIELYHTCEVFKAENSNLKVLVEMLSQRAKLDEIPVEPETSVDPAVLQDLVNQLRKEVTYLRRYEDAKLKISLSAHANPVTDKYVQTLKVAIQQRKKLRRKCERLEKFKKRVGELQDKARYSDKICQCLNTDLDAQARVICEMEQNVELRESCYKKELEMCRRNEQMLLNRIRCLEWETRRLNCELNKYEAMVCQMENEICCHERHLQEMIMKPKLFQQNGYHFSPRPREIEPSNAPAQYPEAEPNVPTNEEESYYENGGGQM